MKAARVMITRFLYKCQDTAQIHRRGSSLPCSAPNLTSQISQTKSGEGSTKPDKKQLTGAGFCNSCFLQVSS